MSDPYMILKVVLAAGIVLLMILLIPLILIITLIETIKNKRKIAYLKSRGYERFVINVSIIGQNEYAWENKTNGIIIGERLLYNLTLKEVKERF